MEPKKTQAKTMRFYQSHKKWVLIGGGVLVAVVFVAVVLFSWGGNIFGGTQITATKGQPKPEQLTHTQVNASNGSGKDAGLQSLIWEAVYTRMSKELGLSLAELEAAQAEGKTPRDLAEEMGIDFAKLQVAHSEAIEQLVADGMITQEQADQAFSKSQEGASKNIGSQGQKKDGKSGSGGSFGGQGQKSTRQTSETQPSGEELAWEQTNVNGFETNKRISGMVVFDGSLYAGTINQGDGAQVWQYDSSANWTQANVDGFGENNSAIQGIMVFDEALYVGTTNWSKGAQVWSYDGANWTQVNESGFGQGAGVARVFTVFEGELYVGVRNDTGGASDNDTENMTGAQVWRYDGGTTWTQVNEDGFGTVPSGYNRSVESMAVFDGNLYAGTWNDDDGAQVWRYDGANWTQVNEDGFGTDPAGGFSVALSMQVFDNELYVGSRSDHTGAEVWRYDGSSSWTQVNESGFGNSDNKAIWNLTEQNGNLYAGTMNMAQGGQVWCYDSGTTWVQVNESGFGNTTNGMITSMVVFDEQLCVGTDNKSNSGEVWCTID